MKPFPISRFVVRDRSMEPKFCGGDHVLTLNWVAPKVGDVIVFKFEGKFYLKRVDRIDADRFYFYVSSDNKKASSAVGQVKKSQVIGKVILKY